MHLKETRQQHARGIGQMRAAATFDLRQIRLADGLFQFTLDGADDFLLRHLAAQSPQSALHLAEIADFVAELHIAIRNHHIANCNYNQDPAVLMPCMLLILFMN